MNGSVEAAKAAGEQLALKGFYTSGGATLFGVALSNINQWLQAGAFIVAMISGICAAVYYVRKSRTS